MLKNFQIPYSYTSPNCEPNCFERQGKVSKSTLEERRAHLLPVAGGLVELPEQVVAPDASVDGLGLVLSNELMSNE